MTSQLNTDYKKLVYPLSDGRRIVVGFFGDVAKRGSAEGWSVIDISITNQDGGSETLCSVLYHWDRKQPAAPGALSVLIYDPGKLWPKAKR